MGRTDAVCFHLVNENNQASLRKSKSECNRLDYLEMGDRKPLTSQHKHKRKYIDSSNGGWKDVVGTSLA